MKVGWLADESDYTGGAELTQAEFKAAAPDGVELNELAPGDVAKHLDVAVFHNHLTYSEADLDVPTDNWVRYHHDMRPQVVTTGKAIFCSPLQRDELGLDGDLVPPPVELSDFRPSRQARRNPKRKGTCSIGAWMNAGKAGYRVAEWSDRNEPVDVYGYGPFMPQGPHVTDCGTVDRKELPTILGRYERFVFLPTALEPFGRCVVEAWAAGCEVITNDLVGARYWIEEAPEKLESASQDFWKVVTA